MAGHAAPLAVGIIWALGLMAVVFGSINIMTVMLGLVLIGLGIDFTLHLVTRFCEERGTGHDTETALARTLGGTGTGVLTGGLTTAAAFFALMVADTRGVFEFGFSAGAGVLLTLVAVFLTLPSLLVLRERRFARKGRTAPLPPNAERGWPLLGKIAAESFKRPALVLGIMTLLAGPACTWRGPISPSNTTSSTSNRPGSGLSSCSRTSRTASVCLTRPAGSRSMMSSALAS